MIPRSTGLLFFAGAMFAAERLTLEQALTMAEQNHPQLRVAGAQIEGAQAGVLTAKAYPNPEFGVVAGRQHARIAGSYPGGAQVYSFGQPLELPKVRETRIQAAEAGRVSSGFALAEVRLGLRAAVKQSFYLVLRRQGEIGLAEENLRLIEDLRRRIQAQVQVGEAARLELTRADAEVATARTQARGAQLRLVTAVATLQAAVAAPLRPDAELEGALDPPARLPPLEEVRRQVLARYPALRQAEAEVRRADARLKNEMAQRAPQPTIRGEYEGAPDIGTYRLGISLPLPLWNRREGPIAEATAALRQANAATDARRLEITSALDGAYGRYQVANQQVMIFEEGVLKQAEAALRAAEAAYKFGERGIMEVLDAQRVLRGARQDYLNAQFDRQAALIELEQLSAGDLARTKP